MTLLEKLALFFTDFFYYPLGNGADAVVCLLHLEQTTAGEALQGMYDGGTIPETIPPIKPAIPCQTRI